MFENVAKQYGLNQPTQDAFAYESQMKYKVAQDAGKTIFHCDLNNLKPHLLKNFRVMNTYIHIICISGYYK